MGNASFALQESDARHKLARETPRYMLYLLIRYPVVVSELSPEVRNSL